MESTPGAWVITQDQNLGCLLTDWKLLLCYPFLYRPQLSHLYDGDIIITTLSLLVTFSQWFCAEGTLTVVLKRFRDLVKITEPEESTGGMRV